MIGRDAQGEDERARMAARESPRESMSADEGVM